MKVLKDTEEEEGIVTLCAIRGCCPTIDFTNPNIVIIRDDLGGLVKLTRVEWAELKTKFISENS